jgi:chorismate mutase/prephenate dehydratase
MKKKLTRIRKNIDDLDQRLVQLVNRRLRLAAQIGVLKRSARSRIYVAEREAEVLVRLRKTNRGPLKETALNAIYREIMSAALALEKPLRIAYLGPEATNTHQAALKKFGASVEYHALTTIGDVFTAVEKGEADYGVVPLENSTQGAVRDAHDLFVESNVLIVAELYLDIQHALLANAPLDRITKVYSKDQALAQCRQWLERNLPHARLVDVDSTAHGVQLAKKEKGAAAVAARIAGERYGVAVLADKIQDQKNNVSRFCIIGREPSGAVGHGRDKTSLIVSLHDEPGALLKMLKPFSRRGLNMTRIESRPSRARQWDYYFFIDITGHHDEPAMQATLKELRRMCPLVKWIGSYPVAKR